MEINLLNNDKLRQLSVLLTILVLGVLIWIQLDFLVTGLLGAVTLYILMRKIHFRMTEKWKIFPWLSSILLILVSLVIIVLPFTFVFQVLYSRFNYLFDNSSEIFEGLRLIGKKIYQYTKIKIDTNDIVKRIQTEGVGYIASFLGATVNTIATIGIMYFVLYFMLVSGRKVERSIEKFMPFNHENNMILMTEFNKVTLSNAFGIPVLGIIQCVFAICGYYFFEVEDPILWGIVTGIASVIPVVGTTAVWLPLSIYVISTGDEYNGYGLVLFGIIVISNIDNVFRFILQKRMADVHPVITILGVIVGVNMFGFIGVIFGPLILAMFVLIVKLYMKEFRGR